MAVARRLGNRLFNSLLASKNSQKTLLVTRGSSTDPKSEESPKDDMQTTKTGWLSKLLHVRQIEPMKEAHSRLLSDLDDVYELQVHCVKPECMEDYITQYGKFNELMCEKKTGAELAGSWTVMIGDQDEAIHLWRYKGGYPVLNESTKIYRTDKEILDYRLKRNKMLRSRNNTIMLRFSFWPVVEPREGSHIFELRSYVLKPGTVIEWGNYWNRGIKCRQTDNEACGGFFSHIGDLYNIHHLWAYDDLQQRKESREAAWRRPGWDETVAYTVPLIRSLKSRILVPTPFSPLQ